MSRLDASLWWLLGTVILSLSFKSLPQVLAEETSYSDTDDLYTTQMRKEELPLEGCLTINGSHGHCFATKACEQWHPRDRKFRVCKWSSREHHVPRTICCNPPHWSRSSELSSMRSLFSAFVEVPEKKLKQQRDVSRKQQQKCGRAITRSIPKSSSGRIQSPWSNSRPLLRTRRLAGGHETLVAAHPWMATIWQKGSYICGAIIISKRALLTAAHCLSNMR